MVGGLRRIGGFGEGWVIGVKKMLGPGGLGIFFGVGTGVAVRVSSCWDIVRLAGLETFLCKKPDL